MDFAEQLRAYVQKLKTEYKQNPEKAKANATEALIRTHVLNKDGTPNTCIVTR